MKKTGSLKTLIALTVTTNTKGEVLIVRRKVKEKSSDGSILSWAFPGGKVKRGEDYSLTAKRELLEETGFTAQVNQLISEREHPQFPVIVHYFHCVVDEKIPQQEISEQEVAEAIWVNPQELKSYLTTDLDKNVAKFLGI